MDSSIFVSAKARVIIFIGLLDLASCCGFEILCPDFSTLLACELTSGRILVIAGCLLFSILLFFVLLFFILLFSTFFFFTFFSLIFFLTAIIWILGGAFLGGCRGSWELFWALLLNTYFGATLLFMRVSSGKYLPRCFFLPYAVDRESLPGVGASSAFFVRLLLVKFWFITRGKDFPEMASGAPWLSELTVSPTLLGIRILVRILEILIPTGLAGQLKSAICNVVQEINDGAKRKEEEVGEPP